MKVLTALCGGAGKTNSNQELDRGYWLTGAALHNACWCRSLRIPVMIAVLISLFFFRFRWFTKTQVLATLCRLPSYECFYSKTRNLFYRHLHLCLHQRAMTGAENRWKCLTTDRANRHRKCCATFASGNVFSTTPMTPVRFTMTRHFYSPGPFLHTLLLLSNLLY